MTISFCRLSRIPLPSAIVKPTVAGEIPSLRSIVAISCSICLPSTTSATSFTVHFIPRAYPTPQLCMLSFTEAEEPFADGHAVILDSVIAEANAV